MTSVAASQRQVLEQSGHALIENRLVVPAGLVTQRGGEPAFANAGWPHEDQIVVPLDPVALGQRLDQRPVEPARAAIIHVLHGGLLARSGGPQPWSKALVLTQGGLAVQQKRQPFEAVQAIGLSRRRAISRVGILAEDFTRMISRACRIATLSAGIDLSLIGKGETLKQASRRARSHSKPRAG